MWDTVYLQNHMTDFLNITVNTTKEKLPKHKLKDKLSGSFKMPCVWETSQNLTSNPKSFRPLFHELLCLSKTCKWSSVLHYKIQEQFNLRCNIQFWKLSLKHRYLGLSLWCLYRAANNGWSTDNVRPDRRLDRSNSGLASHFDRSFLDTNTLFSIQLSLNAL